MYRPTLVFRMLFTQLMSFNSQMTVLGFRLGFRQFGKNSTYTLLFLVLVSNRYIYSNISDLYRHYSLTMS